MNTTMSSLMKVDESIIYDKIIKGETELNYEKLAEDSFKAELDETVKLESDKILSGIKVEPSEIRTLVYSTGKMDYNKIIVVPSSSVSVSTNPTFSSSSSSTCSSTASIMSQHGNKRLFKCGFCSSTFADTYKLERHVKSEHRDITDRAKYETFPWQEPGKSAAIFSSGCNRRGMMNMKTTAQQQQQQQTQHHLIQQQHQQQQHCYIDTSHTHDGEEEEDDDDDDSCLNSKPNILSKLKLEPKTTTMTVSSEYILCQICSKIFASYKAFNIHMNESPACKNHDGESILSSNDVLVILGPEDSLGHGETILDTVVSDSDGEIITSSNVGHPSAVYECHLCRALFATADYLKRHLDLCQTASSPKRRKT